MSKIILGIIGTAGRGPDFAKLSREKYHEMLKVAREFVISRSIKDIISGGAAFSDHIAVNLYLSDIVDTLRLELPAKFDRSKDKFEETTHGCGGTANYYHRDFSAMAGINSLVQIGDCYELNAKINVTPGFLNRNTIVAQESTMMLAFTFGNQAFLADGGTKDTMNKFLAKNPSENAWHCDLNTMTLFQHAQV